jgi:hypothetical protein
MTPRRAQGVKSAAGEVVAVEHAQGTVKPLFLLAAAAEEAGGTDAEPLGGLRMASAPIEAPLATRAARYRDQGRPPSSLVGSIFASSSVQQK